jgi:hypothetical protein
LLWRDWRINLSLAGKILPFHGCIFGGMIKAACTPEVVECRSPVPDFPDAPAWHLTTAHPSIRVWA